jgi:hypothetical protein
MLSPGSVLRDGGAVVVAALGLAGVVEHAGNAMAIAASIKVRGNLAGTFIVLPDSVACSRTDLIEDIR